MKITLQMNDDTFTIETNEVMIDQLAERLRCLLMAAGFAEELVRSEMDPRWGLEPLTEKDEDVDIMEKPNSLRDWFAGMAMSAVITNIEKEGDVEEYEEDVSHWCYRYADSMMKARLEGKKSEVKDDD